MTLAPVRHVLPLERIAEMLARMAQPIARES
jgi:hypothetical protein